MPVCSNLDCYNHVWGNKKRCSQCRFSMIYRCACCPKSFTSPHKIFCDECKIDNLYLIYRKIHNVKEQECRICSKTLEYGERRTCLGDCTRIIKNLKQSVYRKKQLNKQEVMK